MKEISSLKEMLDSLDAGKDEYHKMDEDKVLEELIRRIDLELFKVFSDNIHRLMHRKVRIFFENLTDDLKVFNVEPFEVKIPTLKKFQRNLENSIILKKFITINPSSLNKLIDIYEKLLIQLENYSGQVPDGKERYRLLRSDIDASISYIFYSALYFADDIILCRFPRRHKKIFEETVVKRYVQEDLQLSRILRRGKITKDGKNSEDEADGIISIESFKTTFRRYFK